jgi:hypothetical protein
VGVMIQSEEGNLRVLRITGLLRKAELDAVQKAEAGQWQPASRIKFLVIVENFEGWERNEDWGDISFLLEHDDQIEKIAVVAGPQWKTDFLSFTGAGFRRAPVKFFHTDQLLTARAWLG